METVENVAEKLGIAAILSNNHLVNQEEDDKPAEEKTEEQKEIDEATEQLVEKIENFEMNSMPPDLKLAEMHRDCNKIGQSLDYRVIKSVSFFTPFRRFLSFLSRFKATLPHFYKFCQLLTDFNDFLEN